MKKVLLLFLFSALFSFSIFADCYLYNAGVENWTTNGSSGPADYWGASNLDAPQESSIKHQGSYSAKLNWSDNSQDGEFYQDLDQQDFAGNDYEFTAYIYDNDTAGKARLKIVWEDSNLHILREDYSDYSTNTAGWQYLKTGTITAPANASRGLVEVVIAQDTNWDGDAVIYVDDMSFCDSNGTLAVELGSFYASYQSDQLALHWKTYSEVNNNQWNVYRSTIEDFESAIKINETRIQGNGTTSETHLYTYFDNSHLDEGQTYYYWIESIDNSGSSELYSPISIEIEDNENPQVPEVTEKSILYQNYPNPFNPNTFITFKLEESSDVTLTVYNLKGEKIKTLFNGFAKKSDEIITQWNGLDLENKKVASGIYFYKLKTPRKTYTRKMLLSK